MGRDRRPRGEARGGEEGAVPIAELRTRAVVEAADGESGVPYFQDGLAQTRIDPTRVFGPSDGKLTVTNPCCRWGPVRLQDSKTQMANSTEIGNHRGTKLPFTR